MRVLQSVNITAGTQVVLLLCGHFSPKESESPLDLREYNRLSDWMRAHDMEPASLLGADAVSSMDWPEINLDGDRVGGLLQRGAALALAVEKWTAGGLWIFSRADDAYPERLRSHLGRSAPPLLFGVGDVSALERGGLSIIGSRDIDPDGEAYTSDVARQCAGENIQVVSGGARGVDEIALSAAFEAGGSAVAVLPEGLGRASLAAKYRAGIVEERLVLVSPYAPHAPFNVGNAMGRNKLIYALGDAALVVNTALRTGGTWAGAEEELNRDRARPVFVRVGETRLEGNEALRKLGARAFPNAPWDDGIRNTILDTAVTVMMVADAPVEHVPVSSTSMRTAYDAILPLLLELLATPKGAPALAKDLDVQPAQLKRWLDRAVKEGQVVKRGRPAKFSRASQPSLFGK